MTDDSGTTERQAAHVCVVGPTDVAPPQADAVLDGAVIAAAPTAVLELVGSGAVECIQGLLTNDVEGRGRRGFVYGAVLTPKGMIVCDLFVARDDGAVTVYAPPQGKEALLEVLRRYVPPRLARIEDRSEGRTVLRLAGPAALAVADGAGVAVPEPGRTEPGVLGGVRYVACRPSRDPAFALQLTCVRDEWEPVRVALREAGAVEAAPAALELARILAGWPRLGAEIDAKTLPQEARFEELDGVSYTKGCYVGQETVARLHFRGHANREIQGLVWGGPPRLDDDAVVRGAKQVGRVTSVAWLERPQRFVGLGMIRNSVRAGEAVTAAGSPAEVQALPLSTDG